MSAYVLTAFVLLLSGDGNSWMKVAAYQDKGDCVRAGYRAGAISLGSVDAKWVCVPDAEELAR